MSESDWRNDLVRRYPDLFGEPSAEYLRGWPSVGDGWRELVEKAIERIAAAAAPGAKVTITQIKEKLGGLRIYFDANRLPDDTLARIRDAIELAEARADCTCETCGAEGRLYDHDGWYLTRCEAHAEGEPVPIRPGHGNLRVMRDMVGGQFQIIFARRYDRERDAFVDVPLKDVED